MTKEEYGQIHHEFSKLDDYTLEAQKAQFLFGIEEQIIITGIKYQETSLLLPDECRNKIYDIIKSYYEQAIEKQKRVCEDIELAKPLTNGSKGGTIE